MLDLCIAENTAVNNYCHYILQPSMVARYLSVLYISVSFSKNKHRDLSKKGK